MHKRILLLSLIAALAAVLSVWFVIDESHNRGQIDQRAWPTSRQLDNLVAFARLYGYIRYFHPSDEAALTDWDRFVASGICRVQSANDSVELREVLDSLFRPVAPTLRLFPTGHRPLLPTEILPSARRHGSTIVAWVHSGVDNGDYRLKQIFTNWRLNTEDELDSAYASSVQQTVLASNYRECRLRLRAAIRVESNDPKSHTKLWLKVGEKQTSVTARTVEWSDCEVLDSIPLDANYIEVGCAMIGRGRAWLDNVTLSCVQRNRTSSIVSRNAAARFSSKTSCPTVELGNPDFEERLCCGQIPGWYNVSHRHPALLSAGNARSGRQCVLLSNEPRRDLRVRRPDKPFIADLSGGVSCTVPLALYSDSLGTLPHTRYRSPEPGSESAFKPSGNDRPTRLADLIIVWNVFKHFYPYWKEVNVDWDSVLRHYLAIAATDRDANAFCETLERFVAETRDGHAMVSYADRHGTYWNRDPFSWDWIENHLVVTQTDSIYDYGLHCGDIVLTVQGVPVEQALWDEEQLVAGATEQWRRYCALNLLGAVEQKFSPIVLGVQSWVDDSIVHTRFTYPIPERRANVMWKYVDDPRPPKISELKPGIEYVDLTRAEYNEVDSILPTLARARGIVFDARGYPTYASVIEHLIDSTVRGQPLLLPIFTRPDQQEAIFDRTETEIKPAAPRFKGRIAFLIDGSVISAGETYMSIVEHYRLGELVGSSTAGTNGTANTYGPLPGGYYFTFTGIEVLKHDGTQFHGVGVQPTIPVHRTIEGVRQGRDEVLEKAIDVVDRCGKRDD